MRPLFVLALAAFTLGTARAADLTGVDWLRFDGATRSRYADAVARSSFSLRVEPDDVKGDVLACFDWITGVSPGAPAEFVTTARGLPLGSVATVCANRIAAKNMPWRK
jgi:hypothetical protein